MVTVLLTAAMVTAMAAGCGSSSDSGSDKKESYTIGIEQFAEQIDTFGRLRGDWYVDETMEPAENAPETPHSDSKSPDYPKRDKT